ncbi:carbohydrate-binding protein [Streptomyces sp.]|uniref:carbohydrate-binding protein n=1 Tax=Streptomyces sp. TaxID=1931 RepID=UPI002D792870|nr:carbohydrate-binding protein [Streptomyces sp.]HET6356518.1 carbohydrate-binding protein [Streptomyces sp.]
MRTSIRSAILAAALVPICGILLAPSAQAEDVPTPRELLEECDNGSDYCVFHPDGPPKEVKGESHQVGTSVFNCTDAPQTMNVGWSDTDTETNTIGVSMSIEGGFADVFKTSLQVSYSHSWATAHTESQTTAINVAAGRVGWITRQPTLLEVSGRYELHFGKRYYDHYYWYLPFTATSPKGDAGSVTQRTRPMTVDEAKAHCGDALPTTPPLIPPSPPPTRPAGCSAAAWDRADTYTADNQVSHNGHTWKAKWWTQGEKPGTTGEWGVWQDLGAC